jgi:hypothetical protein
MKACLSAGIVVLSLSACATGAQKQAARMSEAAQVVVADANAARAQAAALPSYQALKDRLPPLDGSPPYLLNISTSA